MSACPAYTDGGNRVTAANCVHQSDKSHAHAVDCSKAQLGDTYAIGAPTGDLLGRAFLESLCLSASGGALGCLLAVWLLIRSFAAILGVNPGMNIHNLLALRINLPPDRYQQQRDIKSFCTRLQHQLSSLAGVKAVGLISDLPLTGENNNNPATAGDRPAAAVAQWKMTNHRSASATYFQAAGIPLKGKDGPSTNEMEIRQR
jgi:hypothetical protein